jgi:N-acetylmuramoyl-L-alanine amidase
MIGYIAIVAGLVAVGGWLLMRSKIEVVDTPNKSGHSSDIWNGIAIHYTAGGNYRGAVSWLQNPEARASAHYVIGRQGEIVQMVDLEHSAWHAGTVWDRSLSNAQLIGIELANHGLLVKKGGSLYSRIGEDLFPFSGKSEYATLAIEDASDISGYWETYPLAQIGALIWLLGELRSKGVPLILYGHEDICSPAGRKTDPGPLFPWSSLPGTRGAPRTRRV